MLNNGLDAASAAFEVGYESATQFNCEYSRFFGQPPMRDIRAILSPGLRNTNWSVAFESGYLRSSSLTEAYALRSDVKPEFTGFMAESQN
jgi:hypothetical protein